MLNENGEAVLIAKTEPGRTKRKPLSARLMPWQWTALELNFVLVVGIIGVSLLPTLLSILPSLRLFLRHTSIKTHKNTHALSETPHLSLDSPYVALSVPDDRPFLLAALINLNIWTVFHYSANAAAPGSSKALLGVLPFLHFSSAIYTFLPSTLFTPTCSDALPPRGPSSLHPSRTGSFPPSAEDSSRTSSHAAPLSYACSPAQTRQTRTQPSPIRYNPTQQPSIESDPSQSRASEKGNSAQSMNSPPTTNPPAKTIREC
jgi:hypothetical protein